MATTDAAKQAEVERVISSFKLNPYDILDLPSTATDTDIRKQYRKKSLMIHPDKFQHEKGMEDICLGHAGRTIQKAAAAARRTYINFLSGKFSFAGPA